MSGHRRVVITGIGAITPLGSSLEASLAALSAGQCAIGPATLFDASGFSCSDAAEIRDWDPRPAFRLPKALKVTDRPARFAVAAAQMALTAAGWKREPDTMERLGVVIGSSGSDLQARDIGRALAHDGKPVPVDDIQQFGARMLSRLNPLWLLVSLPNMTSAHVAIQLEARGPNSTIMSDWVAGQQAIGEAVEWIRLGEADAVLAGGADSGVQPLVYSVYQQAGMLKTLTADGLIPAEGAAIFLLEEREAALARGAAILGEVRTYSMRPPIGGELHCGLTRALCDALNLAGWTRADVDICDVAAPPVQRFENAIDRAVSTTLDPLDRNTPLDRWLGFPLAAAGPIATALTIASHRSGARVLSAAIGSSGEAVALAIEAAAT